ncbi:hypothetical protein D9M72_502100 [compost metagenome]
MLSAWLSADGDRIAAHVGNGHREAKVSLGIGRECIGAVVEQRHLLAARQAGHRAADGIDAGRAGDLHVGDVRDRRRTHTTAVRDGTSLTGGLCADGDRIAAHVGNGYRESEAAVGGDGECVSSVVEQRHLPARQAGHRATDGVSVDRAGDADVGDVCNHPRARAGAARQRAGLAIRLRPDGDRVAAVVGHRRREAEAAVGLQGERIARVVEQRHLLAAGQAGHCAADAVGVGRAGDADVVDGGRDP